MIGAAEHRKQFVCIATHSMRQISCESGVTSEEVSVMGMERRGEQSISLSMSRIAEMTTSAVTNRVKGGQIKRDGKERTHGHK